MSIKIRSETHWKQYAALVTIILMFAVSFWVSSRPAGPPFPQWDKVLHAISGGALAYTFLAFVKKPTGAIGWMLAVGIMFEIVEVQFVHPFEYGGLLQYLLDTAGDLAVEVIGAATLLWFIRRKSYG
ncbi:MAG: hypothetical protein A3C11_01585 [Candidatus Sungbacteria bacterium RIFCSPHIGHO2_02_FULL_49_12]|uniref:VanZ-like domain-containing protein n=1 Tax=Candidatus Sungbacteria bacterium RIFCSPHIGHO2_02_FULL_49_12 TaxID=1802271 RepID=A0A1G2KRG9_9BACT|nr:MAG: hypothetical protein A3C11_01585 [Candidatus Sungbacteria bacterium RIFCSPHIGHO2_02_FULL_49_12]